VGIKQGWANRHPTRDRTGIKARKYHPTVGTCFVHTVIDDHSRVTYAECHDDETATTAVSVLHRAVAAQGRGCAGPWLRRAVAAQGRGCAGRGLVRRTRRHRRTRLVRRRAGLPIVVVARHLRRTRHHGHSALGGQPPISRLNNLAESQLDDDQSKRV
jgi:hypothetical protein